MNLRRASLMVDILMPVSILLIFYPPCLQWYASGVMSIVFLLQKGLFLVCAAYALKYRLYRNKYMVALLSYIVWLILVTYLNGMQIGDIGSYLNVSGWSMICSRNGRTTSIRIRNWHRRRTLTGSKAKNRRTCLYRK